MKSFAAVLSIFLLCAGILAVPSYGRTLQTNRHKQYAALRQELKELKKDVSGGAPYWELCKKRDRVSALREQLYTQYRDLVRADLISVQQEIRTFASLGSVPYVSFNMLPAENLQKMMNNKELLHELLISYPDNAANLSVDSLLELLRQDKILEDYFLDFIVYMRSYTASKNCVQGMRDYEKDTAERYFKEGKKAPLMDILAQGCSYYVTDLHNKHIGDIFKANMRKMAAAPTVDFSGGLKLFQ